MINGLRLPNRVQILSEIKLAQGPTTIEVTVGKLRMNVSPAGFSTNFRNEKINAVPLAPAM